MPGRLFLTTSPDRLAGFLGADPRLVRDEPPRRNIAPGQEVLVCAPDRLLRRMRWGMIPVGRVNARGRPVMETIVNARSETVFSKSVFAGFHRGLVPADGWYEWTGEKRRKTALRLARKDGEPLAIAAIWDIWRAPRGRELAQVATVTCEPSGDVRPVHHRMGVLLEPRDFSTWLEGSEEEASRLMQPLRDGTLLITEAADVDWTAP